MMTKLLVLLLLLSACTFKKGPIGNQTPQGHDELYSEPDDPDLSDPDKGVKRVVIAATNDIEGYYGPHILQFKDEHNKDQQQVAVGGAEIMSRYFNILRETYQNVVLVDSGDLFSTKTPMEEVQKFYDANKYDAITVGLGDFNLRVPTGFSTNSQFFQKFAEGSSTPLVLSNLYELKTARLVEWKGTAPYVLKKVDGVKVGIIGLVPDDIATLTPVDNRVGLFVEGMLQSTLRQARLLRSIGADVIVVLTHQGVPCGHGQSKETGLPLAKVNFEPRKQGACDLKGAFGAYLERLPPNLVDVVVGGRNHEKMANVINGIVVLSGFEHGQSMSYVELQVDTKEKKIIPDETVIHQPVMFCHEFFKETSDCWPHDPSVDHKVRSPATFLGKPITPNVAVVKASSEKLGAPDYLKAMDELKADLVFLPETSGNSQLLRFRISGNALVELLEREYNRGAEGKWQPDPFILKDEVLRLHVGGEEIKASKTYSVIADLEALQASMYLEKWILDPATDALSGHSWTSFQTSDSVKTLTAAPER